MSEVHDREEVSISYIYFLMITIIYSFCLGMRCDGN